MSKILFFTDNHIGARNGSATFRNLFRDYFKNTLFPRIIADDIKDVFCLGDFFDNRNSLTLHDIDYVKNEFIPQFQATGATLHIIAGNHDVAFRNTNAVNSLSMFKNVEGFKVYDMEIDVVDIDGVKFVLCPWINNSNHDEFMEQLKFYANDEHILLCHGEFVGTKMYKHSIACESGLNPSDFSKFLKVLSGHFHHPNRYGNIEYIGALFHFNWQDHDDWRGFQVWDLETGDIEKVENTQCLFDQVELSTLVEFQDHPEFDFSTFSGKIVRIVINEDYDTVDLKTMIARIEQENPVSLDVIDNTILERPELNEVEEDDDDPDQSDKETLWYFEQAITNENVNREALLELANVLYTEAHTKMKEIE